VLDAGWFGDEGDTERWFTLRGDWDTVNAKRFPEGIRAVSDYAHEKGLKFGLWFEIESVGVDAQINETRPDLIARRDGESLHAICLGNPEAAEWAFETLSRLVTEYACDWIKLDYNVDVWAGCNRGDHGHAPGEGLYAHVRAYYALLDRMRAAFPDLIIEACSSGGLRIDLGLLQHLHFTFISDPDYPDHSLQCFWGATQMLAPEACLHFTWSQNTGHFPTLNLAGGDKDIEPHRLDTYMRIGMLHRIGISHKLPEITPWVRDRIAAHIRTYKVKVAPFIREADLYHLTGQPLRRGEGERWAAFEYLKADRKTALVFVFRLEEAEPEHVLKFKRLIPERSYTLSWEDDKEPPQTKSGAEWMSEGLVLGGMLEDDSAILWLEAS
jgi:alpha-galactosidase